MFCGCFSECFLFAFSRSYFSPNPCLDCFLSFETRQVVICRVGCNSPRIDFVSREGGRGLAYPRYSFGTLAVGST